MKRFANKVAVVTGGNSGIGLATAQLFLNEGATVVVTGRDKDRLAAAGKTLVVGLVAEPTSMDPGQLPPEFLRHIRGLLRSRHCAVIRRAPIAFRKPDRFVADAILRHQ